jgi:hypothetical protein
MNDWQLRYASVSESGIDYGKAGPCSGKDCGFCRHLDKVAEEKKPVGEGKKMTTEDKDHLKIIKKIRETHQKIGK